MKKIIILFLLLTLFILSACSNDKNEVKDSPLYNGKKLTIGVVGKFPKVREQNIVFKNIKLEDLSQENLASKYNAVFIIKEHLSEAAKAPYAKIYKNSGIPSFFIESKKSFVPFIDEETDYEEFPDSKSGDYASGYYQSGKEGTSWGFGLYNNTVNEANIKDVFSRIFKTIEGIDNQK
ncbi:hypothetical protein E2K98_12680 [Bacillus salipaludis]|uniref:Lipoprotein n=1 Tax=Bacillus salipaludis TaxID=2547811 RepID=A0A4R5VSI3_9BACI|nr:hypothetical protein [Bacillus salipaludis]TDK61738.1 hypothetical protein E2K98_12680 [Bacillus salipaludis]